MAKWNEQNIQSDLAEFSDDPRIQQELRRRRWRIIAISAAVCLIVGLSARPAYRAFRTYQIDSNLEAAKAAARTEDWGEARSMARSVLIARPGDFDAYRIWFRALAYFDEPHTYLVAASLFVHPNATRQDRLDALSVLARQGPHAVALSAYASMDESMRQEPAALAAMSPLFITRGYAEYVENVLRANAGDTPLSAASLELIRALCYNPTRERVAEARDISGHLDSDRPRE